MRAFNFLKEKAEQEGTGFIPFKDERDELGNLRGMSKRIFKRSALDRMSNNTSKGSQRYLATQQRAPKVRFLKEIYTNGGNSDWGSLTHLRSLDKRFQLNIETEFQVQKPLIGMNQKLQFNDGIVRKCMSNTCHQTSPRLGKKSKTQNFIPPLGYYHPQEILKRQPMLVFMDQQFSNRASQHKSSRTEASTAAPQIRLKLSPNKASPIPPEILEKAFKSERIMTEQKYKYVPQMIDEKNLESTSTRINALRQRVLHQKQNSTSNN